MPSQRMAHIYCSVVPTILFGKYSGFIFIRGDEYPYIVAQGRAAGGQEDLVLAGGQLRVCSGLKTPRLKGPLRLDETRASLSIVLFLTTMVIRKRWKVPILSLISGVYVLDL